MQLVGHVVVTSSDADAGEVAMGIRADRPRTLASSRSIRCSSSCSCRWRGRCSWVAPAFGAGRPGAPRRERGIVRAVAAGVTGAQALFALYVFRSFDGEMTRAAGNDGYQFIERAVWIRPLDIEFFVGVDGVSVAMLLLGSIVSFAGALASFATRDRTRGYFVLYLLLSSASACVFLALDLILFFVAWAAMLFALYLLVRLWGPRSAPRERAASKFLAVAVVGSAFLLVAIVALHQASSRTFLVDGTPAAHSYALPELMRVAYNTRGLVLFGLPFVKVAWVLLLVGFAVPTPMFPLHTYLPDLVAEAPGPVSAMVVGAVLPTGLYGILRVSFAVLPEGSRWASGTLVAFGAVGVAYGAFAALAENDLKRFVAYASLSHAGLALVGIGSLTPQGMAGALVLAFGHGLAASLLVFAVDALEGRCRTRDRERFGGLGKKAPLLTVLFAVAFLTGLGLPGTVTFWGTLLPLLGAFPLHQGFTSFVALSLVVVGLAHLRPLERLCFGVFPARWEKSAALSPFGGKLPDVSPREVAVVAPLLVLVLLLGLWPEPLLSRLSGGVHDAASLVNPPGPDQVALAL